MLAALGMTAPAPGGGVHAGSSRATAPPGANMVHVVYPDEYVVPAGKVFVLTAVNGYFGQHQFTGPGGPTARIEFDGSLVAVVAPAGFTSFGEIPIGLAAKAGVTVRTVLQIFPPNPPPGATLLGYLEDA